MPDIKLFRFSGDNSLELTPRLAQMERNLQYLVEKHLECFLGIRLIAHECHLGKHTRGSIDSLGLDENNCPVIIEYKRFNNDNIICQGLYYLNWLLDHKAEFANLARQKLGLSEDDAARIEFSGSRVICMASTFSRYDEDAIKQIDRNIELIRYSFFGDDMLMLEMLNNQLRAFMPDSDALENGAGASGVGMPPSLQERVRLMNEDVEALYLELLAWVETLGDDVSIKYLKHYVAFSRLKNFTCAQPTKTYLKLWINLDPSQISLEDGFSRDVTAIGHHASGNLEVEARDHDSLLKALPLIEMAYQNN